METLSIALVCSVLGVTFTILSFGRNKSKDNIDAAKEAGRVDAKLDFIVNSITSLQTKIDKMDGKYDDMDRRVTVVEESTKSAHHRIDEHIKEGGK